MHNHTYRATQINTHTYTAHRHTAMHFHTADVHLSTHTTPSHTLGPQTKANTVINTKKHVYTFTNIHRCTNRQKPGTPVHTC